MSDASFDSLKDYNTLMDVFPAAMETPDPVSMLSQALKAVATVSRATSAHLVTDVYSWGYGVEGSLGHNDTANCDIPKPIATFRRMSIQQFSAGRHLSLFVSEHGDVYQCGQFSDCTTASQWIPRRIHALPPIQTTAAGTKACYAISGPSADSTPSCHHARSARDDCVRFCWPGKVDFANFRPIGYGCAHRSMPFPLAACMIVATENAQGGVLFAWGNGTFGQLGLGSEAKHQVPHIVHALMHVRVTIVRAGFHFAAAITSQGHLYTWGYGRHGQLGHNSTANELSPRRVEGLACVVDVALGSTHALAISGSRVFSWGHNTAGCLGIGGPVDRDVLVPTEVLFFRHMQTCHVSAGSDHSLFLCVVGIKTYVYSCGSNRFGQLGINATISHSDNPQCVQEFEYRSQSRRVAQVFAGDRYSVALLVTGQVFAWGDGSYCKTAHGANRTLTCVPWLVEAISNRFALKIAVGFAHSMVLFRRDDSNTMNRFRQFPIKHLAPFLTVSEAYASAARPTARDIVAAAMGGRCECDHVHRSEY
ncbi:hypothetical protein, variant 2, partial [Aphanomyces invadans]